MIKKDLIDELKFDTIAEKLLNSYELVIGGEVYRICELEIYCRNEKHNDEYVHCNKDQSLYEKFYFHKYANGSYKGGTYKGMDITFGDNKTFFGILIRSIYNERTGEFIEGPCRTVNKILEINEYDKNNLKEFVGENILSIYDDKRIFLKYNDDLNFKNIYSGPRIGLSDKYPNFKLKNYRYVIYKKKIKKDKKNLILII